MPEFAIRAFVGHNGSGKTLAMVERVIIPAWRRGVPCVSNLHLDPTVLGLDASLAIPLRSWREIGDLPRCVLALDEITAVLPSRQTSSVPPQLARVLNQLRKVDVQLGWTAPNWARCDVLLREVTQAVTVCRGSLPDRWHRTPTSAADWRWTRPSGPVARDDHGDREPYTQGWGPNRYFVWTTYDAVEFDEFTLSAASKLTPRGVQRYWRPRHDAHRVYNTLQAVALLDHLDDVGLCVNCGGTRTRHKCSCSVAPPAMVEPRRAGAPVLPRTSRSVA